MRDPVRIGVMSNVLRTLWMENPDMRLGQLIANLSRIPGGFDVFNIEDDEMLDRMKAVLKEGWSGATSQ